VGWGKAIKFLKTSIERAVDSKGLTKTYNVEKKRKYLAPLKKSPKNIPYLCWGKRLV